MPTRTQLSNGLTVIADSQRAAPVVAFQVWVKAGSADELPSQVGLAHLHEHMLFKGTATRGLGEIARGIEAHGGEINAWTSFDQTVYHVVMASRFARFGLDVLSDAVRRSAFDAGELSREKEVVCEEIKRSLDMPSRRASKDLFAAAYARHPYGRPVIGFEESVRAHTREGVLGFYRQHYTPSNLVLSAVGDFSEGELHAWAQEYFGGDWGRPSTPLPARQAEPRFGGVKAALKLEEVTEAHLHLAFQIPPVDHPDTAALDVLAMLAGQGDASRLALEVRRKRGLAKDVSTWAWTPRDPGLFALSLVTAQEQLGAALAQSLEVLATLRAVEVDEEELGTVKSLIEAEAVYQRETAQGLARKLGFYQAVMGGIEKEAEYYEAVAKVTPASLREVAERHLTFDRAVVTGLLPSGAAFTAEDAEAALAHASRQVPRELPTRRTGPSTPLRLVGDARAAREGVTIEKLASGATLIVREEHAVPLFAMRGIFLGGLRYEAPEENGLTALVGRTLTRGTATLDPEALSHLTDSLAGSLSAIAGRSSVSLRGEFLSKHFARAFELFAEVLESPAFPQAEVAREQQHLVQDITSRDDRPAAVAFELFAKTLYQAHPYRLSTIGERATVEALTRDALVRYHARHMDPSGLTLSVVGDVDTVEVLERARAAFGQGRGRAAAAPVIPVEPPFTGPREARRVMQKAQTHLVLGFSGARVTDPWRRPLDVLTTILSGQSGRLFMELRDKRSMAYSVSAMNVEGVDPGYFAVYLGTSPEKVPAALQGMREELARVRDELVSEAEVDRARQHLVGTHEIGLQRNGARAGLMALDACYGLGAENYRRTAEEVMAVTPQAVREVARRVIDFERSALVVVGP